MANAVLELHKDNFFPRLFANDRIEVRRVTSTSGRFAAFLWQGIGGPAAHARENWSLADWQAHLANPMAEFYAVYCDGEPAGCFEVARARRLMQARGGTARVTALGLLPEFAEDELGPSLLTRVVEKVLATGADTVSIQPDQFSEGSVLNLFRSQGFVSRVS
jgi:hypothetical protein